MILRRVINKFKVAFDGINTAFKVDDGVKTQFLLGLITIVFGYFLNLSLVQWTVILLCIGAVITAELFNTAIEEIVNELHHYLSDDARKKIKDISAGGVLVISLISLVIMLIIIISKGSS